MLTQEMYMFRPQTSVFSMLVTSVNKRKVFLASNFIIVVAFASFLVDAALACQDIKITLQGTVDKTLPFVSNLPAEDDSITNQISAAQFSATSVVYDSLGVPHSFYFVMYHVDTAAPWVPRLIFDAGDFMSGEKGKPHSFTFSEIDHTYLDVPPFISLQPLFLGFLSPHWKSGASSATEIYILTEVRQTTQATNAKIVTNGGPSGCEQNATNDFDGDGKDDVAIWRPSIGFWAIRKSSTDNKDLIWKQWGLPGDVPMSGDYTGDGLADLVVWRPSEGNWYICRSDVNFDCSKGRVYQFGLPGDRPIKGDFDGDRVLDLAVYRPSNNSLYYRESRPAGTGQGAIIVQQWGLPDDIPLFGGTDH